MMQVAVYAADAIMPCPHAKCLSCKRCEIQLLFTLKTPKNFPHSVIKSNIFDSVMSIKAPESIWRDFRHGRGRFRTSEGRKHVSG